MPHDLDGVEFQGGLSPRVIWGWGLMISFIATSGIAEVISGDANRDLDPSGHV